MEWADDHRSALDVTRAATPGQAWPVRSGDRVAFGHHLFGFDAPPEFGRHVAKLVEGVR